MSKPTTRFVILSSARTGSTLLCNVLGASSEIVCLHELLNPELEQYEMPATPELKRLRKTDVPAFLDRIASHWNKPCFGFKIFPGHADEWLDNVLEDSSWKKIVLYRENVLAVHSSYLLAMARGKWIDTAEQRELVAEEQGHVIDDKIKFNPGGFDNYRRIYQAPYSKWLTRLADAGQPFCFVEYGMLRNPKIMASVFSFLGAKPLPSIQSTTIKTSPFDVVSRYSNPDDVRAHLAKIERLDWQAESFLEI